MSEWIERNLRNFQDIGWFVSLVAGALALFPWVGQMVSVAFFGATLLFQAWTMQRMIIQYLQKLTQHESLLTKSAVWGKAIKLVDECGPTGSLFATVSLPNEKQYEIALMKKVASKQVKHYRRIMCLEEPASQSSARPQLEILRSEAKALQTVADYASWYERFYKLWEGEVNKRGRRDQFMQVWHDACRQLDKRLERLSLGVIPFTLSLDYLIESRDQEWGAIGACTDLDILDIEGGFFTREFRLANGFKKNVERAVSRFKGEQVKGEGV